jgi:hypothetical protein
MSKKLSIIIILLTVILSSCSIWETHINNRYNNKILQAELDPNFISNSDTFPVFKTKRTFTYQIEQYVNTEKITFIIEMRILPIKNTKGALIRYLYKYKPEDIVDLNFQKECPDSLNGYCQRELSTLDKFNGCNFLHPPRTRSLEILEIAPFPQIYLDKKKWSGVLSIPKNSWGIWEDTKFTWEYSVDSISYKKDSIKESYFISSTSSSKFGINTNNFIFHIDSGFTSLNYKFQDYGDVYMKLIDIQDNSEL